jgi:hypothetical protein
MVTFCTGFNEVDERFFNKNFTVLEKNVNRLQDATAICLVETHYKLAVQTKHSWLIEKIRELFNAAYVVLVEGDHRGQLVSGSPLQAPFISHKNIVKGWDSAKGRARTLQLKDKLCDQFAILRKIAENSSHWKEVEKNLKAMLDSLLEGKLQRAACQALQEMPYEPNHKKLHQIYHCILSLNLAELGAVTDVEKETRNLSFVEAHEDEFNDSKKVISIVGRRHVFDDKVSGTNGKNLDIIKTYLKHQKYVILQANENMESVHSVRKELEIKQAGGKGWYLIQKIKNIALTAFVYVKSLFQSKNAPNNLANQYKEMTLSDLKEECVKFLNDYKLQHSLD